MTKKPISKKFFRKRQARKMVFSALYAHGITGGEIALQSVSGMMGQAHDVDLEYAQKILTAYSADIDSINRYIDQFAQLANRAGNTEVERAILQMATTELIHTGLPQKVVINEAIEIAKEYGSEAGYKFINAILDKIGKVVAGRVA